MPRSLSTYLNFGKKWTELRLKTDDKLGLNLMISTCKGEKHNRYTNSSMGTRRSS